MKREDKGIWSNLWCLPIFDDEKTLKEIVNDDDFHKVTPYKEI